MKGYRYEKHLYVPLGITVTSKHNDRNNSNLKVQQPKHSDYHNQDEDINQSLKSIIIIFHLGNSKTMLHLRNSLRSYQFYYMDALYGRWLRV